MRRALIQPFARVARAPENSGKSENFTVEKAKAVKKR
jgi:hypothetical protein